MTVGIQRYHNPGWMQSVARWDVLDQYTANAENEEHANSIQSLQNAIIQANGLRYAVEENLQPMAP